MLVFLFDQNVPFAQRLDTLRINESLIESPLIQVIAQLEKKYRIPFYYKQEWIEGRKVNSKFDHDFFAISLGKLLDSTGLSFAIFNDNSVIIAPTNLLSKDFYQNLCFSDSTSIRNTEFAYHLYWNPNVSSNQTIKFFTSDFIGDYTICVEGIDENGQLLSATKKFTVNY